MKCLESLFGDRTFGDRIYKNINIEKKLFGKSTYKTFVFWGDQKLVAYYLSIKVSFLLTNIVLSAKS